MENKGAIIYFLHRDEYFKVDFVFGQKATDIVLKSDITEDIKTYLAQATKYAESRGVRIDVNNKMIVSSI